MQFEDTTLVSAYADDLAIACSGRSKIDMTKKLQKEVDKVVKWSDDARLTSVIQTSVRSLSSAYAQLKRHGSRILQSEVYPFPSTRLLPF